jgi:YtkA-like
MAMCFVRAPRALGITLGLALAACGTTSSDDDSGPLVQVADVASQSGAYEIAMLAHSPSPARGDHSLELVVTSAQDSSPIDGLSLTLVPWMPAMGHGASVVPTVTPLGDGAYELDNVDLFMAGLWELRTTFASPTDYAAPSVQVE